MVRENTEKSTNMEQAEIIELFELPYSDLLLLSSDDVKSSPTTEELQRLDSVRRSVMEALGPMGPGLLSVGDVPGAASLRRDLPLARDLALLDAERRKRILKASNLSLNLLQFTPKSPLHSRN